MKKLTIAIAAVALFLPVLAGATVQRAGKWQVTMEMDMPGMPMKMPAQTFTTCVTKEQAEKPQPPKQNQKSDCEVYDYKIDGNVVSWKVKCPKENMTGDGTMKFTAETYEGLVHAKMGEQTVTTKMTGKRIGDCEESKK